MGKRKLHFKEIMQRESHL